MKDMWYIYTQSSPTSEWTFRMQSISKEYLKTRGQDWKRLNFIDEYKVTQEAP